MEKPRSYRQELPLAEIIPPDRRRLHAALLVLGGMIAGAGVLAFAQYVVSTAGAAPKAGAAMGHRSSIRSFTISAATADLTSPRSGAPAPDGKPDQSFDLVVDGPVVAIVLDSSDSAGRAFGTQRWTTAAGSSWQLAVFENGVPKTSPTDGALVPLGEGTHALRIYASDSGGFAPGSYFRVSIVRPSGEVETSDPLAFTGHGASREALPTGLVPSGDGVFDRGAAAATLGAVRLDRCASLANGVQSGRVEVVFAPDGSVAEAKVIEGAVATPLASCVEAEFRRQAQIPGFRGAPVRVKKSFTVSRHD